MPNPIQNRWVDSALPYNQICQRTEKFLTKHLTIRTVLNNSYKSAAALGAIAANGAFWRLLNGSNSYFSFPMICLLGIGALFCALEGNREELLKPDIKLYQKSIPKPKKSTPDEGITRENFSRKVEGLRSTIIETKPRPSYETHKKEILALAAAYGNWKCPSDLQKSILMLETINDVLKDPNSCISPLVIFDLD